MARYTTTITSPWNADDAFAYIADLRHFEDWDPGVASSKLVEGDEPGVGAAYDVRVGATTLRYETLEYEAPRRTVVEANSSLLRSYDVIEVRPLAEGCEVHYDATLELKGLLKLGDRVLGLVFNRIGDKAAAGMRRVLKGRQPAKATS